jgi:uncharacterized membrane protein YdjX (TVP38/TMEM64 family)
MSSNLSKKQQFWLLMIGIGTIAILSLFGFLPWQTWLSQIHNWLKSLGFWSIPAFISVYLLATLVGLPAIFFFLGAGSLFGFAKGFLIVSLADTLSAAICYGVGRTFGRKAIKKWIGQRPRFKQIDHAVSQKGWKIVLLTRLSPILPSNVINYGFSLTKIDFWHYLVFSWLGMLPVIGLYVYLGSMGTNLIKGENNPSTMTLSFVGILATIILLFYMTKIATKVIGSESDSPKKDTRKNSN